MLKKGIAAALLGCMLVAVMLPTEAEAACGGGRCGRAAAGVCVDANNDGICDNCNFVDANNDGICDNLGQRPARRSTSSRGTGRYSTRRCR